MGLFPPPDKAVDTVVGSAISPGSSHVGNSRIGNIASANLSSNIAASLQNDKGNSLLLESSGSRKTSKPAPMIVTGQSFEVVVLCNDENIFHRHHHENTALPRELADRTPAIITYVVGEGCSHFKLMDASCGARCVSQHCPAAYSHHSESTAAVATAYRLRVKRDSGFID